MDNHTEFASKHTQLVLLSSFVLIFRDTMYHQMNSLQVSLFRNLIVISICGYRSKDMYYMLHFIHHRQGFRILTVFRATDMAKYSNM